MTARLHGTEIWTQYYLAPEAVAALRQLAADPRLAPLGHYGAVDVGVVTGRNSFFCLTAAEAVRLGLADVTVPLVSRSAQLRGLTFSEADLDAAASGTAGARTRLLVPATDQS
nr:hypothetical protein [Micromonospora sp. DSM 115978]